MIPDYGFKEELAGLYKSNGMIEEGKSLTKDLIKAMNERNLQEMNQDSAGHYSDKEMANVYLLNNDYDNALKHALLEYNRRPGNIEVNELLAWIYFNTKQTNKAKSYLKEAMKTNSRNPRLLERARMIQQ